MSFSAPLVSATYRAQPVLGPSSAKPSRCHALGKYVVSVINNHQDKVVVCTMGTIAAGIGGMAILPCIGTGLVLTAGYSLILTKVIPRIFVGGPPLVQDPIARSIVQNEHLLFRNGIGIDFVQRNLGDMGPFPQVPDEYYERREEGYTLLPFPETVTITVDENSPFVLDASNAVNGRKARLVENPARAPKGAREITVPLTPNNIIILFLKFVKDSQFGGVAGKSIPAVLEQNGDVRIGPSKWSYQKNDAIFLGKPYQSQSHQIGVAKKEIIPLVERLWFHLLSSLHSGAVPQSKFIEKTSTVTVDEDSTPLQTCMYFETSGPHFHLVLCPDSFGIHPGMGAVVKMPS